MLEGGDGAAPAEAEREEQMRYALLIYGSEAAMATATEAEGKAMVDAYNTFTKDIVDRGLMQAGEALQPTSTATTVQVRSGETLTTAAGIPGANGGSIEVRPIMEFPDVG